MLEPYRVLDLTDEKGLLCGQLLAEYGADVIKVERPGGDPARNIGPFFHDIPDPEKSLFWFAYNTNKRGITLNLESADGQELFKKLVKRADFVIESFPPGYLEKLGLSYTELAGINPRIILTSITPFGQTGPYSTYKASDLICMAMGGMMYISGDADRPPVRISAEQAYLHGSAHAAWGSLVAHYCREKTGLGQQVDVSVQECVLWTTNYLWSDWYYGKRLFGRSGSRATRGGTSWLNVYRCKDGYVMFRVGTGANLGPGQARFVKMMDKERRAEDLKEVDWAALDMWGPTASQIKHWEEVTAQYLLNYTKAEILQRSLDWDYMCAPINDPKDIVEYPQLAARDFWEEVEHPELGTTIKYPGAPFQPGGLERKKRRRAPLIGEHNEEIYLKELGLTKQQLVRLKEVGVI
ncbi:MAG: CoA transferase [Chloroflexota bacterium]